MTETYRIEERTEGQWMTAVVGDATGWDSATRAEDAMDSLAEREELAGRTFRVVCEQTGVVAMTIEYESEDAMADVVRDLARQDTAGETDDSYARTGDALDTIRRWRASAAEAGDRDLVQTIDALGEDEAARIYAAAREAS